jgi:hypothetical protein
MQRITKYVLCILSLVIAVGLWLKATVIQVPSGTWVPSGSMAEARSGAASVLLQDGTILVTGGEGASGVLSSAEFFSAGSFAAAPAMNVARSRHAAVVLQDARVLVTGGKTSGHGVTNAAEVYSPALNSWIVIASMADARSGHTAVSLKDGRVLLAGGEGSAGAVSTLEVFDPVAGTFTFAGTMSSARKDHAAALLADGRVLIAGGSNGSNELGSTEIYDPETGAINAGPALSTPRAGLSATTLMDGKVLIAGGNNGPAHLATAEIFNSATGVVSPIASSLASARRGHSAFLLPNNNHVLIVGGTALATTELFRPWDGNFYPTGSMAVARVGSTGSPLGLDGLLLVAGGTGLVNSELYGFATVKTDKDDYAPGELVTMTGSGWQPGETVSLFLHEINNPDPHDDLTLTAVADGSGRILNRQFAPDEHDIGIRFYLTATGANSQAQTTFTDGVLALNITSPTAASPNTITTLAANVTISFTYRTNGSGDATSVTATGSVKSGATIIASNSKTIARANGAAGASESIIVSIPVGTANGSYSAEVTVSDTGTGNPPTLTDSELNAIIVAACTAPTVTTHPSNQSVVVGQQATFVAAASGDPTPTVQWEVSTNGGGTWASLSGQTSTTLNVTPTAIAGFNGNQYRAVFTNSCSPSTATSNAATLTVSKAATTTTLTSSDADNTTVFGESVTFTATVAVTAPGAGTPTGNVQFFDGASPLGAPVALSGTSATLPISSLTVTGSPHSITAKYVGNTNFLESTSNAISHTVNPAATTTTITSSSPNPSFVFQQYAVNWSVVVVAPGSGTPTGTVQVSDGSATCSAPVGNGTCSLTSNTPGVKTLTATFTSATPNHLGSNGTAPQTVSPRPTSTVITLLPNTINEGQNALVMATLVDASGAAPLIHPAGPIVFSSSEATDLFSGLSCSGGGAVPVTCNVTVSAAENSLHYITASFSARPLYAGSLDMKTLTVTNVAPVITSVIASPGLLAVNGQTTITANFTDVGILDAHTCSIAWDDGSAFTLGTVTEGSGSGSCSATKTYTAPGVYTVAVTVTDDDTGSDSRTYEYVVVYDPSAGFVTGGGWIQSPAGAYAAGPTLTGKANFGFVSKYLKGSNIPTGETEFQLHFATFNFHSTSYQWLVVSGARAQYKGNGQINGGGNYGFLLTATDGQINGGGGVDKFRIKIWDIATSTIVYDNVPTASDDIDAANPQAIAGGSINIQVPKK